MERLDRRRGGRVAGDDGSLDGDVDPEHPLRARLHHLGEREDRDRVLAPHVEHALPERLPRRGEHALDSLHDVGHRDEVALLEARRLERDAPHLDRLEAEVVVRERPPLDVDARRAPVAVRDPQHDGREAREVRLPAVALAGEVRDGVRVRRLRRRLLVDHVRRRRAVHVEGREEDEARGPRRARRGRESPRRVPRHREREIGRLHRLVLVQRREVDHRVHAAREPRGDVGVEEVAEAHLEAARPRLRRSRHPPPGEHDLRARGAEALREPPAEETERARDEDSHAQRSFRAHV